MSRLVRDFIEISDTKSLDALIERLIEVRDSLPEDSEAAVKMQGDDIFGRHLAVAYYRPQSQEELECEARYANAYRESLQRSWTQLEEELGVPRRAPARRHGGLRAVA